MEGWTLVFAHEWFNSHVDEERRGTCAGGDKFVRADNITGCTFWSPQIDESPLQGGIWHWDI